MTSPREAFDERLTRTAARVTAQLQGLLTGVESVSDQLGWTQLESLGTAAITDAQADATGAVRDLLTSQLVAAGLSDPTVTIPVQPGTLRSGGPVHGLLAATERIVGDRVAAGVPFGEAVASSASVVVGVGASEPARIGRDGMLDTGLTDPRFHRFRRVVNPGACSWCRMQATRGAVFLTEQTAGRARAYHLHCRCHIELVVDPAAIEASKDLSGDWHNAIRDDERMRAAGALEPEPVAPAAATPPLAAWDDERARLLLNDELDTELADAYSRADLDAADVLGAEMERRERWAVDWHRPYQDFDELVENDRAWLAATDDSADAADDLPAFEDVPRQTLSRRAARAQWEAEQELRRDEAERDGGGIRRELLDEARGKGITLWTLMTGNPRTAYKYANEELLGWWAKHGGRKPLWEVEAANGRLSTSAEAQRRLSESKARVLAEELVGKDRIEAMALRDAQRARQRRAKAGPRTVGDKMKAERRRYQRLRKLMVEPES